jgi:alpha-beta hydrolase superfamily lysophospholipase
MIFGCVTVSMDKEIKMFPGAFHNLYQEVPEVRLQAVDDTIRWIRQRVPH